MKNSNYYVNIFLIFIKKKFPFSLSLTLILYYPLYKVYYLFITANESVINQLNNTKYIHYFGITIPYKSFALGSPYFKIILFCGLFSLALTWYSMFFTDFFKKKSFYRWYDVKDTKMEFNPYIEELVLGRVHNQLNTDYKLKPLWKLIRGEGIFLNIFITGSIGTGKTISGVAHLALQAIGKFYDDQNQKWAGLIIDVKQNFYMFVLMFAYEFGRFKDIIIINLKGNVKYNPLHKPEKSEMEIANDCRYVLEMMASTKNSDDYWLDKAEQFMAELFKLTRIYNDNYLNMEELHFMGTNENYRNNKIALVEKMNRDSMLTLEQVYNLESAKNFLLDEFEKLDQKIRQLIVSELSLITQPFISNKTVRDIFSPSKEQLNFIGFEEVIKTGKIVICSISFEKNAKVAKLISTYLKVDYQNVVLQTLETDVDPISKGRIKFLIADECQDCTTSNDPKFLSKGREARAVSIYCTQTYSAIKDALKGDDNKARVFFASFINKIWYRSDDIDFTIKKIVEQLGEKKIWKESQTIGESGKANAIYAMEAVVQNEKSSSESTTRREDKEKLVDTVFLNRTLEMGEALVFYSDGQKVQEPTVIHMPKMFEGRLQLHGKRFKWITGKKIFMNLSIVNDLLESEILSANNKSNTKEYNVKVKKNELAIEAVKRVFNIIESKSGVLISPKDWFLINNVTGEKFELLEPLDDYKTKVLKYKNTEEVNMVIPHEDNNLDNLFNENNHLSIKEQNLKPEDIKVLPEDIKILPEEVIESNIIEQTLLDTLWASSNWSSDNNIKLSSEPVITEKLTTNLNTNIVDLSFNDDDLEDINSLKNKKLPGENEINSSSKYDDLNI